MKKIFLFLMTFSLLFITGCKGDSNDNFFEEKEEKEETFVSKIPYLSNVETVTLRTTVNVTFTIMDQDEILTELKLIIKSQGYTKNKTIDITGGSYSTEEDVEVGLADEVDQFLGESHLVTFTDLKIGLKYTISFVGTYNDKVRTIYEDVEVETSETGGSFDTAWEITTYEELNTLVRDDNDGYFILMNDIDCDDSELKPFFSSSKKFEGNFNGNNKTVSNFYQDSYDQDLGMFGNIGSSGNLYDLNVENIDLNSSRYTNFYAGGIAGTNTGTITNVHVTNVTITTKGPDDGSQFVGGFVGQNKEGATITNCSVTTGHLDLNVPGNGRIGGFAGTNEASTKVPSIIDCEAKDVLIDVLIPENTCYDKDDFGVEIVLSVGGFIGDNRGNISCSTTNSNIIINVDGNERNEFIGKITFNIGGFVGNSLTGSIYESTTETKNVTLDIPYIDILKVGGFVGHNDLFANITECKINADVIYAIIVGEDTILNEDVSDNKDFATEDHELTMKYIGEFIGLNNNIYLNDNDIENSYSISFNITLKYYDEIELTYNYMKLK